MLSEIEWSATRLSLQVALAAVAASLCPAIALGHWLARTRSAARLAVEMAVDLPLVLPPVVTGYVLLLAFGRHGPLGQLLEATLGIRVAFTWLGAAVAAAVVSFPLIVRTMRLAFSSVDPRLELAARSLGASRARAFFVVALPLAWRGVLAGSILCFARSLGEFGATIMIAGNVEGRTQTIPLAIYSMVSRPGGFESSWRLVLLSILLAAAAMVAASLAERRQPSP